MQPLNRNITGLAVGAFFGFMHFLWAILVALGLAKIFIDWILSLHFIEISYSISAFNFGRMILLVLVTFICGYIFGWVLAWIWNMLIKKRV